MLILTRRVGESLIVGDDVVVNVLGVKGNQVRIGVDAPDEVVVHREEIFDRIKKEKNLHIGQSVTTARGLAEVIYPDRLKVKVKYECDRTIGMESYGDIHPVASQ